jgi:hypothetical protein
MLQIHKNLPVQTIGHFLSKLHCSSIYFTSPILSEMLTFIIITDIFTNVDYLFYLFKKQRKLLENNFAFKNMYMCRCDAFAGGGHVSHY